MGPPLSRSKVAAGSRHGANCPRHQPSVISQWLLMEYSALPLYFLAVARHTACVEVRDGRAALARRASRVRSRVTARCPLSTAHWLLARLRFGAKKGNAGLASTLVRHLATHDHRFWRW